MTKEPGPNQKAKVVKTEKPLLSKRKESMLLTVEQVALESPQEANSVAYMSKGFTVATMPHSKVEGNTYVRKNGTAQLCMMCFPGQQIPYGTIPRLFIIFLITEIVRTQKKEIELGHNFNDFLKKLKFDTGGYTGKRVKQQIKWLSRLKVGYFNDDKRVSETYNPEDIIRKAQIWWIDEKNDKKQLQQHLFQSTLTVSDSFFEEAKKAFPVDMRIVDKLRNSAMKLDIYLWLTFKMYSVKKALPITYEGLKLQFGADYEDTPKGRDNFRTKFRKSFKDVLAVYPANVDLSSPKRIVLYESATSVPKIAKI